MLLSAFLSFLLARKLKGVMYVIPMVVIVSLVSYFSTFGQLEIVYWYMEPYSLKPISPLPLSFPFYSDVYYYYDYDYRPDFPEPWIYATEVYHLKFLGLEIYKRESVLLISEGVFLSLFFFLVSIMGTYLGYGISKTLSYNLINRKSLQDVLTTYVAGTIFFIIAGLIGHLFGFFEFEVFIFIGIGAVLFFIGTWQLLKLPEKQ